MIPPLGWLGDLVRRHRVPEALRRARAAVGLEVDGEPIHYQLGAGGRDPDAPHPAQRRGGRWVCDCSGATAWFLGLDRFQPDFPRYGGWINTDSMIASAEAGDGWFEIVERPRPGDLICYGKGPVATVGHVGLVRLVPRDWEPGDLAERYAELRVIHCSAGLDRHRGHAIGETGARPWADPAKQARFLRFIART